MTAVGALAGLGSTVWSFLGRPRFRVGGGKVAVAAVEWQSADTGASQGAGVCEEHVLADGVSVACHCV